ncbi:MAG: protein TolR [Desulfuromonadales bacterium]|jgi:biopolymer transport protein TolR
MEVGQSTTRRRTVLAQINVTPFVDVMLVLLIIFMVTAPMMERGVDVALPEVENAPNLAAVKEPLIITVTRQGDIMVGNNTVDSPTKLTPVIEQVLSERDEKAVYLEADKQVPYGRVVQVMAAIKKAGVAKLGMVAQEPEN